jgi:spermidine synthase
MIFIREMTRWSSRLWNERTATMSIASENSETHMLPMDQATRLRRAMSRVVASVSVVTPSVPGNPDGTAVTAFASFSMAPPLLEENYVSP